ncbi:oocyte zinc finger protein XlCOF8.4-like isoform X2 [Pseudophryne corroboree]|uniref:oocyte zinc finger protein XlCOF8.4-like isoform X2 n=1 Tax=Pseudophryne corroboree TaxID=495146 RepID=UPI003081671C
MHNCQIAPNKSPRMVPGMCLPDTGAHLPTLHLMYVHCAANQMLALTDYFALTRHKVVVLEHSASLVMKMNNTKEQISEKILNHALEIIYLLTGEVPIKCDDIAVYFSMEEWDYIKGHKQQYQDVIMETDSLSNTVEITKPLDLELPDLHNEDFNFVTIDGKGEYEMEQGKCELNDHYLEPSAAEPATDIMEELQSAAPLLHSAIKVEITDEIQEDHAIGGLTNTTSLLDKIAAPRYRWDQNIWSISERIVCDGNNRLYNHPAMNPPGGEKYSQQTPYPVYNQTALDEKPFRCLACGQLFKYKSSATRHYNVVHGVKPHQCNECGRRFSTKFNSVVHKCRAHKNARDKKPYQAPSICDFTKFEDCLL